LCRGFLPRKNGEGRKQLARYSLLVMVGTACLVQTLAFLFR